MILRAKYVWTGSECLENAAIRIDQGTIAEVGPESGISGSPITDLGAAMLLPGFVNAHTHLELTHLHELVPPGPDFADWLGRLVEAMRRTGDDPQVYASSVADGALQSLRAGVTCVGDITRFPKVTRPVLAGTGCRAVSFGEVIALGNIRHKLTERLMAAADRSQECDRLTIGVSPHSPYALEPQGLKRCSAIGSQLDLRLSLHLSETLAEAEYTRYLRGPLRNHFERLGIWDDDIPCPAMAPIALSDYAGLLSPRTVLAHVNYATDEEIEQIAASGAHVAFCPRTQAAFCHPPHPFRDMLAAGVNVCIGTDSLASNPDLSVLNELRYLRERHPDVPAEELLSMGTTRAAAGLGLEDVAGAIATGRSADLTCVPLDPAGPDDPLDNLLRATAPPSHTWAHGSLLQPG
jgi:cytosine/adenosine deaminase-related metal-dependent hydrolase